MTSATPCSIDIDGVPVTLTPGTTQQIPFASFRTPGHSYLLTITTGSRFVTVACSCPAFHFRGACKHGLVALDIVSVELHGVTARPGVTTVDLPGAVPVEMTDALWDVA
jgi:hypothetical protein